MTPRKQLEAIQKRSLHWCSPSSGRITSVELKPKDYADLVALARKGVDAYETKKKLAKALKAKVKTL